MDDLSVRLSVQCIVEKRQIRSGCRLAPYGPGIRQVVRFGDQSTGRGTFGGDFGVRHCNQWGLYGVCVQQPRDAALFPNYFGHTCYYSLLFRHTTTQHMYTIQAIVYSKNTAQLNYSEWVFISLFNWTVWQFWWHKCYTTPQYHCMLNKCSVSCRSFSWPRGISATSKRVFSFMRSSFVCTLVVFLTVVCCHLVAGRFDLLVPAKWLVGKIISRMSCDVLSRMFNPTIDNKCNTDCKTSVSDQ